MKVLSLFDGISCARLALKNGGWRVDEYWASEIDKEAIAISQKNWANIRYVGDVQEMNFRSWNQGYFDLLIGGSPCQDLSIARKGRKGLDGEKSSLFYEFVRILKEVKPKYFVLENVASMRKDVRDAISKTLGVEPIMIDAALVSAQSRKRLFWTNIPGVTLPKDRGLVLKDIMQKDVDEKYFYNHPLKILGNDKPVCAIMDFKNQEMHKRIYNPLFKAPTLTTCRGGGLQKKVLDNGRARKLTPVEYERLQGLPDDYTAGFADSHRYNTIGNAFNVDVVTYILSFMRF